MPELIDFDARNTQILRTSPAVGPHFVGGTVSHRFESSAA
jgi:hypothetical protein